jgi:hypothetical protein
MQETIACLKLSYQGLTLEMSIPEMVWRHTIEGKMGLTRGERVESVRCRTGQLRMSYDPASEIVFLAGRFASHQFRSSRTRRRPRFTSVAQFTLFRWLTLR